MLGLKVLSLVSLSLVGGRLREPLLICLFILGLKGPSPSSGFSFSPSPLGVINSKKEKMEPAGRQLGNAAWAFGRRTFLRGRGLRPASRPQCPAKTAFREP